MRDARCPKCQHNRILHVAEVADTSGMPVEAPDLGHAPPLQRGFYHPFRLARVEDPDPGILDRWQKGAVGLVEAYVCRACGYTELYTRAPDQIPIDGIHVREIVGHASDAPYR